MRLLTFCALVFLISACGENDPSKAFTVQSKAMCGDKPCIQVDGVMKPNSSASVEQAKAVVQTAIGILEK